MRIPCKIYDELMGSHNPSDKGGYYQPAVRIGAYIVPVDEWGYFCGIDGMVRDDNFEDVAIFTQDDMYGAFRISTGEILIEPSYEHLGHFYFKKMSGGDETLVAEAKQSGKYGAITIKNEIVERFEWDGNELTKLFEKRDKYGKPYRIQGN